MRLFSDHALPSSLLRRHAQAGVHPFLWLPRKEFELTDGCSSERREEDLHGGHGDHGVRCTDTADAVMLRSASTGTSNRQFAKGKCDCSQITPYLRHSCAGSSERKEDLHGVHGDHGVRSIDAADSAMLRSGSTGTSNRRFFEMTATVLRSRSTFVTPAQAGVHPLYLS